MNCRHFEKRIHALLDRHQSIDRDPALQRHAQHCKNCWELWHHYQLLITVLGDVELKGDAAWEAVQDPVAYPRTSSDRVADKPHRTIRIRTAPRSAFYFSTSILAATVLLLTFALWYRNNGREPDVAHQPTAVSESFWYPPATTISVDTSLVDLDEPRQELNNDLWCAAGSATELLTAVSLDGLVPELAWDPILALGDFGRVGEGKPQSPMSERPLENVAAPRVKPPTLDAIRSGLSPFAQWVQDALQPVATPWQWLTSPSKDASRA